VQECNYYHFQHCIHCMVHDTGGLVNITRHS